MTLFLFQICLTKFHNLRVLKYFQCVFKPISIHVRFSVRCYIFKEVVITFYFKEYAYFNIKIFLVQEKWEFEVLKIVTKNMVKISYRHCKFMCEISIYRYFLFRLLFMYCKIYTWLDTRGTNLLLSNTKSLKLYYKSRPFLVVGQPVSI